MTGQLLETKLFPPPGRLGLILRPRLLQQLDYGLQCKLTLLSAPAGFGKTTLLADWISRLSPRAQVAWFSIDEADNDPGRFFEYLFAALQRTRPDMASSSLNPPEFHRPRSEPLLITLLNELKETPLLPVVLILDDYHLIDEQIIHQAIDFLLDHQPTHFHLVLATRADPPLHLSRLRGRNQLNEVRMANLRFTTEEAAAFLNQTMGLSLTPDQIDSLASRSEGWIAGLQLAALSLRGQENQDRFVQTFTGGTHFVLDYLSDEVFQLQPPHIQDFLLQTAILNRLSGPLCDAVCQINPGASQKILDYLEHANLFILPLDDKREWYRYHQLFADLLRQRLGEEQPDLSPALYRRASAWCDKNALPHEAIEYAFLAGDPERAADLIETVSQGLLMHGKSATLLRWLECLPPQMLDERIPLAIDHAWAMLLCSRPIEAIQNRLDHLASQLSGLPGEADREPLTIRTLPLRAMLALYRGQFDQAVEMALRALEFLEEDQVYQRGVASLVHAISFTAGDNLDQFFPAIQQAAATGERTGNLLVTAMALMSLAENERKIGHLRQSQAHLEQALQLAVDTQGNQLPIAGRVLIALGDLGREWNDLENARSLTEEGITLLERSELVGAFQGYMVLARIEQAVGNVALSRQAIQKASQSALAFDLTDLDDQFVAMLEARLSILQGDLETANRWVESRHLITETGPSLEVPEVDRYYARFRKYELEILAHLWLAQGRTQEGLSLLQVLFAEFERVDRPAMRIEIRLLQALACRDLGEDAEALDYFEQAIELAKPEGYIRIFLDEGEGAIALLRQAVARPTAGRSASTTAYLHQLLAAAGESEAALFPTARVPAHAASPTEPLSNREMDILRLLAGSLSATEIADELVVSPSTVRSHIKSIYAKLEVHSRYQAVARARELKLI
jgi:LuxR family maltose regulon positive regulatory protein